MADSIGGGGPTPVETVTVTLDTSGGASAEAETALSATGADRDLIGVVHVPDRSNVASGVTIHTLGTSLGEADDITGAVSWKTGTGWVASVHGDANTTTGPADIEVTIYEL